MENIFNIDYYDDITSHDSSDESSYYTISSSPDILSYEELNDYDYSTETRSSSVSSGTYEPTFYPAAAYWIEVLGIFPTELRGTTYYNPLFYYVPVYSNLFCPLSPDPVQQEYETESTEYYSSDSDTDFSSSSSDTYYTAEESESYFDPGEFNCEAGEFGCLNSTNLEKINFEYSANDEFKLTNLSKSKEYHAPESLKSNCEEDDCDDISLQNDVNVETRKSECVPNYEPNNDNGHYGSENSSSICDEIYKDILSQIDNSFETKESKFLGDFNCESYDKTKYFLSGNSSRDCDDIGFGDITLSKISTLDDLVKDSSIDDIKINKDHKHRPFSIRGISERRDFSEKCSMSTFEFGDVNNKDRHNQGLKKCNTFEDLSDAEPKQYMEKIGSLENLSRFDENEMYERDLQCENSEIGTDNYECNRKSLSFDPEDFEFTEEEVKHMKDEIYRRALSGKLYQKTHIPPVDVLTTIYEEKELFDEIDEQQADSQASCLIEEQGRLNDSLCNLYEISSENREASEESQQKPKKKRMKRLREFLARIFCCVKPP